MILWIKVAHVLGIVLWVGSMFTVIELLRASPGSDPAGRSTLDNLAKKFGRIMDVGAAISIAAGVGMILLSSVMANAYMHAKLALVVIGMLGGHGFLRAQIKKHRRGDGKPMSPIVHSVLGAVVIAIVVLVIVKPF